MKCRHCENPNAIITKNTCCTGCDRLAQEGHNYGTGDVQMVKTDNQSNKDDTLPQELSVSFTIPYRLKSEANLREHWTKKHKRHKQERGLIALYLRNHTPSLPCHVRLIRIAPRPFDDSNLVSGFKHIQDSVSDHLVPGLAPGRADSDPRIKWSYNQEKGKPKEHAIKIEIYT